MNNDKTNQVIEQCETAGSSDIVSCNQDKAFQCWKLSCCAVTTDTINATIIEPDTRTFFGDVFDTDSTRVDVVWLLIFANDIYPASHPLPGARNTSEEAMKRKEKQISEAESAKKNRVVKTRAEDAVETGV